MILLLSRLLFIPIKTARCPKKSGWQHAHRQLIFNVYRLKINAPYCPIPQKITHNVINYSCYAIASYLF